MENEVAMEVSPRSTVSSCQREDLRYLEDYETSEETVRLTVCWKNSRIVDVKSRSKLARGLVISRHFKTRDRGDLINCFSFIECMNNFFPRRFIYTTTISSSMAPTPNIWEQMGYVPPRGACNHKDSLLSPKCPCLRFMIHPHKVGVS